jgi:ADP-heptose:LPS heptosyltransferase
MKPDFSWACTNINSIKKNYNLEEYIVLFPFCSAHLQIKKWPYYNKLIELIKNKYNDKYKVVVAPGPSEIKDAKDVNALLILEGEKILNISKLSSLIKDSAFVVANDTGPAHMAAHLSKDGTVLFGNHTSAKKVSIETDIFKAITVEDLKFLSAEKVYSELKTKLELIN